MATLESHCRTVGGVTLVELCVTAARPRRVRVENCLEGPVWPPRSDGVPEPGWDEDGFEGRVKSDEPLVLGYASPAEPADPPARIVEEDESADREPTPEVVLKALGRREPPRDAMPEVGSGPAGPNTHSDPDPVPDPSPDDRDGGAADAASVDSDQIDAWFAGVEDRLETAEELAAASSVEGAAVAVEQAGGIGAVRRLQERIEEDRTTLARLDRRCSRARERAEAVDVPVEGLARLA